MVESISFHHFAYQFTFGQCDANRIAARDLSGFADDVRSRFIPDDRVAAAQHRERAQAVESRGAGVKPRFGAMMPCDGGGAQPAFDAHQTRSNGSEAAAQIELLELQP
jgi:hypothetical protein